MITRRYRKKPVVIEATEFIKTLTMADADALGVSFDEGLRRWVIPTLEGPMIVSYGDYIITGIQGERYPCKPDIFWKTYAEVEDEQQLIDVEGRDVLSLEESVVG